MLEKHPAVDLGALQADSATRPTNSMVSEAAARDCMARYRVHYVGALGQTRLDLPNDDPWQLTQPSARRVAARANMQRDA